MATHSSVLAWRIPETREPGELPSMGSHRVGHDWSDLAAAAGITTSVKGNVEVQRMTSSLLSLFYRKNTYYRQTEGLLEWTGLVFLLGLKRFHSWPFSGPAETRTSSTGKIKFTLRSSSTLCSVSKAMLKIIIFRVSRVNCHGLFLIAQSAKNLPAVQEILVWSMGQEDPLEKEIATHSSILA